MVHIIFWIYILSLVVTSISIFLSAILAKRVGKSWYYSFIHVLLGCALILLVYTIFYFLYRYGEGPKLFLNYIMFITIWLICFLFTITFYRLAENLLDRRLKGPLRIALICLVLLSFILFILYLILKVPVSIVISIFLLAGYIITLFSLILKEWKMLVESKDKRLVLYFICFALLLLPLEVLEFYIHKWFIPENTSIPMGVLTFSIFCLLANFYNIMHSIRYFYGVLLPEKSESNDYDDVPAAFIEAFSITGRESEIVEYIVKGYNYQDIAEYLNISKRTVEKHSYNVYKKCEITNRVELLTLIREYQ